MNGALVLGRMDSLGQVRDSLAWWVRESGEGLGGTGGIQGAAGRR